MTRAEFLSRLRLNLGGLPKEKIDEVIADYESHFQEGLSAGRSEEEVAAALGDPQRLARELRADIGFRRWETERSPGSLLGVIAALVGLATLDLFFLLPVLGILVGIFCALAAASIGLFVAGCALLLYAIFPAAHWFGIGGPFGGFLCAILGLGLCALSIGLGALLLIFVRGAVGLLVRYARLHFSLIDSAARAA